MTTTTTTRTVPSAVLGEYLADVERFDAIAPRANKGESVPREVLQASLDHGLASTILELYGEQAVWDYWNELLHRAQREHARGPYRRQPAPNPYKKPAPLVEAPKVEEPKPKPKPKRTDARNNERRMREAILKVVRPHGWADAGIRKLARLATMPHRTARDTLTRMEADSQIKIDDHWGQGRRTGVGVLLHHPAWSQHENAQSLELSSGLPPGRRTPGLCGAG
jgi:hypothetical protein